MEQLMESEEIVIIFLIKIFKTNLSYFLLLIAEPLINPNASYLYLATILHR